MHFKAILILAMYRFWLVFSKEFETFRLPTILKTKQNSVPQEYTQDWHCEQDIKNF